GARRHVDRLEVQLGASAKQLSRATLGRTAAGARAQQPPVAAHPAGACSRRLAAGAKARAASARPPRAAGRHAARLARERVEADQGPRREPLNTRAPRRGALTTDVTSLLLRGAAG